MAQDLGAIRRALADQIRAGVAREFNVAAHPHPSLPVPRITLEPGSVLGDYLPSDDTHGSSGVVRINLTARCIYDTVDPDTAARIADDLLGNGLDANGNPQVSSIGAAVNADKTLGGVVQQAVAMQGDWVPEVGEVLVPIIVIAVKEQATV